MSLQVTENQITAQSARQGSMNILVLDDSEVDRKALIRMCKRAGLACVVTEAASLSGFVDALDHTRFDLIFIDYMLGADTGLDALKIALEHDNQSAAASIMLSGEGQIDVAVEAMRQGCADYLTKSMLSVEALQKSIATAVERRAVMAQLADHRHTQRALERSIQRYAEASTAEMRSLLSGTLRRVRLMRRHKAGPDYVRDLSTLEVDIDRLWEALPKFRTKVASDLAENRKPNAIH